jgi:hypothetical protein
MGKTEHSRTAVAAVSRHPKIELLDGRDLHRMQQDALAVAGLLDDLAERYDVRCSANGLDAMLLERASKNTVRVIGHRRGHRHLHRERPAPPA